jgi:thymidylate synthase (FAD)
MKVELVSLSKPSAITGTKGADDFVAYCARVSNPGNQNNCKTAPGLLKYLIKNEHWSPFEMVSLTMSIQTTRDISRQIIRHRSFSYQEFSQRYAISDGFESRDARKQDPKNRQNSIDIDPSIDEDKRLSENWQMKQVEVLKKNREVYEWALQQGIAKEQARVVLPEGLTSTTLYMAGTLRSWVHYCQLRMANGTQKEHQKIAELCWDIIGTHFPSVIKAYED